MKLIPLIISFSLIFSFTSFAEEEVPSLSKADNYQSKMPIKVLKEYDLPKGWHEGLFFDGKNIWVSNGRGYKTWVVDPETGKIISEIDPGGSFTEGITSGVKNTYWITDWEEKKIYRARLEGAKMVDEYDISLDPAHPAGCIWTGEHLYVITWTRGMGTKYHLMQLDENERMFRKFRIKRIHEPAHMAWDGRHLWITSWYNQLVYKVDVETFQVLGSFKSPVPETTGITWDGGYFWITGTHSGLYKIELED